jgi:hypothetical protein
MFCKHKGASMSDTKMSEEQSKQQQQCNRERMYSLRAEMNKEQRAQQQLAKQCQCHIKVIYRQIMPVCRCSFKFK